MQEKTEHPSCVITDANILINFIKIGRVDILQQLRIYAFYLPEEVYREITYPAQRRVLDHALKTNGDTHSYANACPLSFGWRSSRWSINALEEKPLALRVCQKENG